MQYILRILMTIIFITSCKPALPSLEPYSVFVEKSVDLVCKKMLKCNESFIRTFPAENRKNITLENCRNSALSDLDPKLKQQTETMKALSKSCYEKILEIDCKGILTIPFSDLSCLSLTSESSDAFKKKQ
jgi:hypothetical protein